MIYDATKENGLHLQFFLVDNFMLIPNILDNILQMDFFFGLDRVRGNFDDRNKFRRDITRRFFIEGRPVLFSSIPPDSFKQLNEIN